MFKHLQTKIMLLLVMILGGMNAYAQESMTIDFESAASTYTDWDFTYMLSQKTNSNVTAHGGSYFGITNGSTGKIVTKEAVENPQNITFFISKQTTNTSTSSWYVKVSTDGTEWLNVGDAVSASNMTRGNWNEVTRDLSSYTNVYVGIFYDGTTAVRCIDDVTLTYTASDAPASALSSIAISGDYPTTFAQGDEFSYGDMVVTATYEDESTKNVTAHCEFSGYNLNNLGSQTVTVSYTENNVTRTASYIINVTEYVQATSIEFELNNAGFGTDFNGTANGITDNDPVVGTKDRMTVTYAGSGNHYINNTQIRFYPNNKLTFEAPEGYDITSIVFTPASGATWSATISASIGTYTAESKSWSGAASSVVFTGSGSSVRCDMAKATVTLVEHVDKQEAGIEWSSNSVEIELNAGDGDYTLPTLTNINNLTVTYSSSNEVVALVDENTGDVVVETSAVGTATITATFAGNDTYKPATASYVINVVDPNAADGSEQRPYSVADVIDMNPTSTSVAVKTGVYVKGFIIGAVDSSSGELQSAAESNSVDTNLAIADSPTETEKYCTVQLPSGDIRNALKTKNQIYNIGVAQVLVKGNIKKYCNKPGVRDVSEGSKIAEQVSISAAGMSTYYTDCALDFTGNKNIYAYTVTDGTNKVTYNKVDVVPAETAVVLRSVNERDASELIPVMIPVSGESTATASSDPSSDLKGTLEDIYVTTGYVLNNGKNGVGFYKANPDGTKIAAHRAYLPATSSAKDFIGVDFESVATAISAIETETETNNVYDLQGRKVTNPAKGLYIVNGKKVVIK